MAFIPQEGDRVVVGSNNQPGIALSAPFACWSGYPATYGERVRVTLDGDNSVIAVPTAWVRPS